MLDKKALVISLRKISNNNNKGSTINALSTHKGCFFVPYTKLCSYVVVSLPASLPLSTICDCNLVYKRRMLYKMPVSVKRSC